MGGLPKQGWGCQRFQLHWRDCLEGGLGDGGFRRGRACEGTRGARG